MEQRALLSKREELKAIALAQRTPKSSHALQQLIDKLKARIIDATLKDSSVQKELMGRRFRVLDVDLREEKPLDQDKNESIRLAEVGIYDYDRNLLVVPLIDLRRATLVRIEHRRGIQPPLSADEEKEARSIVLGDRRFRKLKGLKIISFPARLAFLESDPRYGHRCFALYFWTEGKKPKRVADVIVDLSAQNIVSAEAARLQG